MRPVRDFPEPLPRWEDADEDLYEPVASALALHNELRDALIDAGKIMGLKSDEEERVGG